MTDDELWFHAEQHRFNRESFRHQTRAPKRPKRVRIAPAGMSLGRAFEAQERKAS